MPQFEINELQPQIQLRDISEETYLIHLAGDISEIFKLALFEMSVRRYMRHLRDASEMHQYRP